MKKLFLLLCTSCIVSVAIAQEVKSSMVQSSLQDDAEDKVVLPSVQSSLTLKLEGVFDFQSGFRKQGKLKGDEKNVSDNRGNFAFATSSAFSATVSNEVDGVKYGAKIVLLPTTKAKGSVGYNGSHLFLESDYGKVEVGAPHDAGAKMRLLGNDVAAGPGAWDAYSKFGEEVKYKGLATEFGVFPDYFFDRDFKTKIGRLNDGTEPARKISYYTPEFNGFQFGISYIPDSGNVGGASSAPGVDSKSGIITAQLDSVKDQHYMVINRNVKDAFSLGLSYKCNIADGIDLKLAVTGEYGKPATKIKEFDKSKAADDAKDKPVAEHKLSALKTYNIGAALTYGNFGYSVSYGSLNKSLTSKQYHKTGRDTKYYQGAVAYTQGPIKTSVTYFKSNCFKNTVDAVTLGTEYKMLPGLLPYAEIAYFQAKGKQFSCCTKHSMLYVGAYIAPFYKNLAFD
jgi:hypothetical protein